MKKTLCAVLISTLYLTFLSAENNLSDQDLRYVIVDTGVTDFYDNNSVIQSPEAGEEFSGQDAQYDINPPSYTDNNEEWIGKMPWSIQRTWTRPDMMTGVCQVLKNCRAL